MLFDPSRAGRHKFRHRARMGGNEGRVRKEEAYHVPEALVLYVSGLLPVGEYAGESEPLMETSPPVTPPSKEDMEAMMKSPTQARFLVGGGFYPADLVPVKVQVVTRSQLDTDPSGQDPSGQEDYESDREGVNSEDGTPPLVLGGESKGWERSMRRRKGTPDHTPPSPTVPAGC